MPGPWITVDELTDRLADVLSKSASDLVTGNPDGSPSKWTTIVADSVAAATLDIAGELQARGYLPSQIDRWDRRQEFSKDIGLYWCLYKGGALANYSDVFIKELNRRKELATVPILAGGLMLLPGPAAAGILAVGFGRLAVAETARLNCSDWFN